MNNRVLGFPIKADGMPDGKTATVVLGQADFVSGLANRGSTAGPNTLYRPINVFFDSARNWLWVTDGAAITGLQPRVLVYDLSVGITNGMDARYVVGQPDFFTVTAGTTNAKLSSPWGVYVTASGLAYIADGGRVVTLDVSAGMTNGQTFTHVLGQTDFTHNAANAGGSVGPNTFSGASGILVDEPAGLAFIAEYKNKRVSVYDISGGIIDGMNAKYFIGQPDGTSNSTLSGLAAVGKAEWMALNKTKNILYVGCQSLSRVEGFDLGALATGMSASHVFGQPANFIDTASNTSVPPNSIKYRLNQPQGIALDNDNGLLMVADQWNRVMFYKDSASTVTGIHNTMEQHIRPMEIYPNPAADKIFIKCPNPGLQKITIMDMTGRMVYSNTITSLNENGTGTVDNLNLSDGVYTVMAITKNAIFSQRLEVIR